VETQSPAWIAVLPGCPAVQWSGSRGLVSTALQIATLATALRQPVIGMITDSCLAEHENPGETTILILHGRVRLSTADLSWEDAWGRPADHFPISSTAPGLWRIRPRY
jgi:hypothetical protein